MNMIKKLSILIFISLFVLAGCARNRVRPHGGDPLKVAHSMSELDNQSRNVRPHMVYSYPEQNGLNRYIAGVKYRLLSYINNVRAQGTQCGGPTSPLGWNKNLEKAAINHAVDMEKNNYLSHLGSGTNYDYARKGPGRGSNFYERILFFGYPIRPGQLAGEILSYTKFRITGTEEPYRNFTHAVDNFLRSPTHCKLLMNPRFHDVGIAAYRDQEKVYWVIEFAEVKY